MSRLESRARFVAASALAALAIGCGHPPLTAYVTPQPIMLGPVRRLPGGEQAPARPANEVEAGSFTATASAGIQAFSTPMPSGGAYTTTTAMESSSRVLDAAAIDAIQGDARGRLWAREVACSSVVMYAFVYMFSEEQCTLSGRTERPRPEPKATATSAPVPEAASSRSIDAAPL